MHDAVTSGFICKGDDWSIFVVLAKPICWRFSDIVQARSLILHYDDSIKLCELRKVSCVSHF